MEFLERADGNGLLLDEQGLGKTIQECMLLNRNADLLPALIVVKSGLRSQWFAEVFRWTGHIAQVISGSKELPDFDMFDVFIVSIDTLRLLRGDIKSLTEMEVIQGKKKEKPPIWTDEICARFKHICIDESHLIKNDGSSRTRALRKIVSASNDGNRARVICMSGTNIEKHAGEYFVTLNLVKPEMFSNKQHFIHRFCDINNKGKIMGLRNPKYFHEMTQDFIIRRLRKDVLPDLPKVFRQFRLAEIEGDELKAYIKIVKEFMDYMDDDRARKTPTDILGYLSRMRHMTGIAKVDAAISFIEEFLLESGDATYEVIQDDGSVKEITAGRKLVVFLHHKMAGAIMQRALENICKYGAARPEDTDEPINMCNPPLYLNAEIPVMQRQALIEEFKKPENRLMIASTMVAAEGINMQFVSDCLMMERQWNPSKEEQAEGRFPRPGSKASKINAHYLIAAGTVDDFLTTIVEQKRANVSQTLGDNDGMAWDQDSLVMELANALKTKGLAKWRLSL